MDDRARQIIIECKRQEESCLYTSTAFFEWLKKMRLWRTFFVVVPIALGSVATWSLLAGQAEWKWLTGVCALIAGVMPAIYKALDFDVSLKTLAASAHEFKILQDRFRQAAAITAVGPVEELKAEFAQLMERMDNARANSLTPPDRFFTKAQEKVSKGDYDFNVDPPRPKS